MAGSYARKAPTPSNGSSAAKPSSTKRNHSILNFFQKTDTPPGATSSQRRITQFVTPSRSPSSGRGTPTIEQRKRSTNDASGGLFLEDKKGLAKIEQAAVTIQTCDRARSRTPENIWGEGDDFLGRDDQRLNEHESSVKRRKVDSPNDLNQDGLSDSKPKTAKSVPTKSAASGPFIDESDSEDDIDAYHEVEEAPPVPLTTHNAQTSPIKDDPDAEPPADLPPLVREDTSHVEYDENADFDDLEEDEPVGEEFRERPWEDEEQDLRFDDNDEIGLDGTDSTSNDDSVNTCPLCQKALTGLNETDIAVHVNDCLDGKPSSTNLPPPPNPAATPSQVPDKAPTTLASLDPNKGMTRLERAAIARPAQRDPYSQSTASTARSAFSKMMAGNAEDNAWAIAAANEVSSRGKQAYQRTCPFYKIMPGFSICVDAFRYGAVEGCNAYFLSHYHSDHYMGLTKSWCHGPIYCSRATGNLVRQQLRVDPKWIVDLDFEKTTEVPDTGGAQVTMIPANHCPGSSLFLFEKSFGNGPNARRQRILHCGDFRASPDQVQHPLLRPDPINPVSGQSRQQRIDVCYLDTTYLNPKYAFPSQEDVITACSDLCVRLNQEAGVGLEPGKTAGGLMNKFLSTVTGKDSEQEQRPKNDSRLLVVIGTYSIGKERICLGIARALKSKIFATPQKQRVCACLEDPDLSSLLTHDPKEAQVHMQTLFETRADTLTDYLDSLKPHFSRVVGFRPTGWSYRPPAGRMLESPPVSTVLRGEHWKTPFTAQDLTPQRGSTRESACFGVPYSEHSSFRELTMFCCALRIGRVIPTVNVGNARTRERMKAWMDRWEAEKKKNGLFPVSEW